MSKLVAGTRVTLVDPNYKMRTTGTLVSDSFSGVYGTFTLVTDGDSRFRSEGVLEIAQAIH
ncbi:hypothetical protein AOC05_17895 [Arthrobacter alpinus]|uniref:Uncharacterized protein n=1 Tax=Arthrobacter alpinus TaxID=656366 RepID=A0A0M4QSA1_9MICC|nr:hypothetical protein [Arthrobacter alpinus]ALE93766.1 hypothetical protein AOC05_17895 [Arthrobacter alpinus]